MTEGATSGGSHRGTVRGSLRNAELRKLLSALTVTWFGDWLYGVAIAVYVYDATGSAGWVGVTAVARTLPYFLLTPYAGVLADRLPKVRLLVFAQVASAAFMAVLTLVAFAKGPVVVVIALVALTSIAGTPNGPAIRALTPEVVEEDDLPAANALTSVAENVTVIAGPAVSVALIVTVGAAGAFAANTLTFVVAIGLILRLRADQPPRVEDQEAFHIWQSLREGFATSVGSRPARACLGFAVLAYALYGVDSVLFVVVATEQLASPTAGLGYLVAALGVGGILVVPLISRLTLSTRLMRVLTWSTIAYCLPTAFLVLVNDLAVAVLLMVVRGAAFVVIDVVTVTAVQRLIPSSALGRVFAVYGSLVIGGATVGSAVVAPAISAVGVKGALLVFGLVPAALALLVHPRLRDLDERASVQRDAMAPALEWLERVDILAACSRLALEQLAAAATVQNAKSGTVVVEEGAVSDAFFVVVSGRLGVTSTGGRSDGPVQVGEMGPGDCFGEIGLIHQSPRTATVRAVTDCAFYRFKDTEFRAAVNESPVVVPAVLALADGRLARSHSRRAERRSPPCEPVQPTDPSAPSP